MIRNYTYAEQMSEYLFEFGNNFYTGLRMEIVILLHTCSNPSSKNLKKKYIVSTIKTILDKTPSVSQAKKKYSIPFSLDPPILKEDKLNII